ncbi:MAG: glycosyltransferase family 2 protein [Bacteroidota bacterium]|nr:glycosyltransferase family 2 protein [Bacteroidota bacterium]
MNILWLLGVVIEWIVLVYFYIAALYLLFFSIIGLGRKTPTPSPFDFYRKILILIPAFKEDEVILDVVKDALKQDYPTDGYRIVVIADSLAEETVQSLLSLPIDVIDVKFSSSTKSKALNAACAQVEADYDIVVVLDADNLMEHDFLKKINLGFANGFKVIQGHRIAKNSDTSFALLDGISEEINNHIFRQGHRAAGLSSALIGSAMGFEFGLFKRLMKNINAIGGFDKELELSIAKEKIKIDYLSDAYVFDEKVQNAYKFTNQRRRWLSAQFFYFGRDFIPSLRLLFTEKNLEYFNKAFQFVLPPRILLLGVVILINIWVQFTQIGNPVAWLLLLIINVLIFLFSVPSKFYTFKTLKAIIDLPIGFFWMTISLIKSRRANREFIHTAHGKHI